MFQLFGQFPGCTVREKLDSAHHYERYLVTKDLNCEWFIASSLNRELCNVAELRLVFQDACRKSLATHLPGVLTVQEIGMSRSLGVFALYPYTCSTLTFGEISACASKYPESLTPAFYASILLDVARILDAAQQHQLLHGSIIPPFITMMQNGEIVLKGFVEASMRRRFLLDTELNEKFDAPEWRRRETISFQADIYSIGALLYQGITNEYQPDEWEPRWGIITKILARTNLAGDVLSAATDFFRQSLAEQPAQRFASFALLIQELEKLCELLGGYVPCEKRAEALKTEFDPFPPVLARETAEPRNDVINLITGEVPNVSADVPKTLPPGNERQILSNAISIKAPSSNPDAFNLDETLISPTRSREFETRVIHRSSNSFRTVNPALRDSVCASPEEVLASSRYQILETIGSGGTGTVYKVLDTTMADILALKVLRPELVSNSEWLQRFKRELKITRALEHAYILPAYHLEEINGIYFFTMRYIDGKNLSEYIHTSLLPIMMSLRILIQVAEALVAAHDQGVIHRDIKPANIMIETGSLHPYLMDFGIASSTEIPGNTFSGQGIGTPYYMAPEQARGDMISSLADVYSFGVVCYECFTQKVPFDGPSPFAIYRAQEAGSFTPICELNPMVPKPIAKVVEACISRNPEDRPASMRIVLDGLGRLNT